VDTTGSLDEFDPVTDHAQAPLWIYSQALGAPPRTRREANASRRFVLDADQRFVVLSRRATSRSTLTAVAVGHLPARVTSPIRLVWCHRAGLDLIPLVEEGRQIATIAPKGEVRQPQLILTLRNNNTFDVPFFANHVLVTT
jgi:hypothetical protein